MERTQITPEVIEAVLRALRSGKTAAPELASIAQAVNAAGETGHLTLFDRLYQLTWQTCSRLRRREGLSPAEPVNRQEALEQLAENFNSRNRDLASWSALYFRYFSGMGLSVGELSGAASVVPQQFRRRVKQGLALLAQEVRRKAPAARPAPAHSAGWPLPEFTTLVGVQKDLALLERLFSAGEGPGFVSLEGMGGIGKSALARSFISRPTTPEHWNKIIWVSARQSMLSEDGHILPTGDAATTFEDITARLCDQLGRPGLAFQAPKKRLEGLESVLSQEKHLIVVDNLETVEEYRQLAPALAKIAGISRFLITTRQTMREFSFVYTITLKELDRQSALELIETELARRGRAAGISPEGFAELYPVVGGLPLALKLAAAQLYLRPLADILKGFRQARVGSDNLYRYLYWQTWHSLHDPARRLLLSFLPSDPEGEDLGFLQRMSGQPEEAFFAALKELDRFSLLEVSGDAERPLYRLHRLTATFLQTDVLNLWSEQSENG